jgi:hypothetical protein
LFGELTAEGKIRPANEQERRRYDLDPGGTAYVLV